LAAHEASWLNQKHRAQWRMTLTKYAGPLRDRAVADISVTDVREVLEPIWRPIPETASRLRGRIEAVLDYAIVSGWRSGPNPAVWRGHLDRLLPRRSKVRAVKHYAAMPSQDLPRFMRELRQLETTSAHALEYLVLTAARSGEVRGMHWSEVDLDGAVWTVPASRMKARREHRVPLSEPAVSLLRAVLRCRTSDGGDKLVFAGHKHGRPLSIMAMAMTLRRMHRNDLTVHGFRSTFRDWAGETTAHPREVIEAALAHRTGDKVEQAYARGDLFSKRHRLMADWAEFCNREPETVPACLIAITTYD
jgi:integrase